jgi:hypothetical protein
VLEPVTFIGFIAFFVWNAAMGVTLLRRARGSPAGRSAAAPAA